MFLKLWVGNLNYSSICSKDFIVCQLNTYAIYIMPLSVHFLYPVPIEDGTKSGFTAILVALQIEFDIFNFYLAVDHISSVAQIH